VILQEYIDTTPFPSNEVIKAELAARWKSVAAEVAHHWNWCGSRNGCLLNGCKSVTAKLAAR
jgi:hypothetical protein